MEEIEEYVQTAKRQKVEIDELQERIAELEEAQVEMDVRIFGREAEERETIRQHEKEMMASQMALADSKLKTATLEAESGKKAGGSVGVASKAQTLTILRVTSEAEFQVKGPFCWVEIVRLMENLREFPDQWEDARIWRQFSESVMQQIIARLHQIRTAGKLPKILAGFDKVVGKYSKFFSTPVSPESTFADSLESYLRANDRDKQEGETYYSLCRRNLNE